MGTHSSRPGADKFDHDNREQEEEDGDEPPTSEHAGGDFHILTTKVLVPDDIKKVQSSFGPQRIFLRCQLLLLDPDKTWC